jgi:hypothetical protein
MNRWLYSFLIERHPGPFRLQFGDEMLSIFDDSRLRRRPLLVLDAALSLLRQWLLRSEQNRRGRAVLAGGPSHEFHQLSERLQKRASRLNLAWVLSVIPLQIFVATEVNPITRTLSAGLLYALLPVCTVLSFHPLINRYCSEGFVSISHSNRSTRTALENKRIRYELWAGYTGTILVVCTLIWTLPVVLGALVGGARVLHSWAFVNALVTGVEALVYFAVLKRFNQRALAAVQQEIETAIH